MPKALFLRITLEEVHPPIWREIAVPEHTTFAQLHELIQMLFEWQNMHLYAFYPAWNREISYSESTDDDWLGAADSATAEIRSDLERGTVKYVYDFGEEWQHRIKLLEVRDTQDELPKVYQGRGEGGLEYLGRDYLGDEDSPLDSSKLGHDDLAEMNQELKAWAKGQDFAPVETDNYFDDDFDSDFTDSGNVIGDLAASERAALRKPYLEAVDAGFGSSPEGRSVAGYGDELQNIVVSELLQLNAKKVPLRDWFDALRTMTSFQASTITSH